MIEETSTRSTPTQLLLDIVYILIQAAKCGRGDFVNLCYTCTGHKTHYDHGMYAFAMSLELARDFGKEINHMEKCMSRMMEP